MSEGRRAEERPCSRQKEKHMSRGRGMKTLVPRLSK